MTSYSYLDQVLHKQFLGDNSLSNYLHKRILKKSSTLPNKIKSKNIFITGLARSGTTALQNKIFSSGEIGSLMYKFMPFILYPKLAYKFSKLKSDKKTEIKERLHNDGIKININSPECLDENFWIKSDKKFYGKNYLRPISISNYLLDAYSYFLNEYQSVQGFDRMLIKNNNNHLRIKNLSEFFNESFFLVLFRDPLSHSISLLSQHRNFINLQEKDPFILEYMNLIGHFEFGSGSKSFIYNEEEEFLSSENKLTLNYWLKQWINTHSWFLNEQINNIENVLFISYEDLCSKRNYYKKLCKKINIKNYKSGLEFNLANKKLNNKDFDSKLVTKAMKIFNELKLVCFK